MSHNDTLSESVYRLSILKILGNINNFFENNLKSIPCFLFVPIVLSPLFFHPGVKPFSFRCFLRCFILYFLQKIFQVKMFYFLIIKKLLTFIIPAQTNIHNIDLKLF